MPSGTVTETIPSPSAEVFRLLHDYRRRLEWDTLLQTAVLEGGDAEAGLGGVSLCVAKWYLGGIGLRTKYVAFHPGSLAAVQMVNRPAFFDTFAASIRHEDLSAAESTIVYRYTFTARPRFLRFILHPVMSWALRRETRKRLQALRDHFRRG